MENIPFYLLCLKFKRTIISNNIYPILFENCVKKENLQNNFTDFLIYCAKYEIDDIKSILDVDELCQKVIC